MAISCEITGRGHYSTLHPQLFVRRTRFKLHTVHLFSATWEGNFTVTQPSSIPSLESTKRIKKEHRKTKFSGNCAMARRFQAFFGQAWAPHTQVVDASEPQVLASFLEMAIFSSQFLMARVSLKNCVLLTSENP